MSNNTINKPENTSEPIPELINTNLPDKQYEEFQECCDFIEGEMDRNIVNWYKIRENSPHTMKGLFDTVTLLTEALLSEDEMFCSVVMTNLADDAKISDDVLWVIYVAANHQQLSSSDPKKNLTNNAKLIDLFIFNGLQTSLLALAIAGERERELFRKRRAHYNILSENEFVVKYLVPKYVAFTDIIYTSKLTPLEYWHEYDNTVRHYNGMGCSEMETFEKNETIRSHLYKNSLSQIDDNKN